MNRLITAGIVITAALMLTSCSGSDEPESPPKSTAAPKSQIPKPDSSQADALVDELDAIAPGLADEPDDTIDNARNTCSSILGGGNNLVQATKTRFTGDGVESLSDDQAEKIISVVKAEPWCTT